MGRWTALIGLVLFLAVLGYVPAYANPVTTSPTDSNARITSVVVNGSALKMDTPPVNLGGRVMVPARAVVEALGGSVEWVAERQTVLVYRFTSLDALAMRVGSTEYQTLATEGSPPLHFDRAPVIANNRTLVPVRLLANFMGADVTWDQSTQTVSINGPVFAGTQVLPPAYQTFALRYRPRPAQTTGTGTLSPTATGGTAGKTPILGRPMVSHEAAAAWAKTRGASDEFIALAPLYWAHAGEDRARPDVAYAQAAKETGFGRFGGVIDASYRNPCGLKRRDAGSGTDYVPAAHQRFSSWKEGVQAHIDHLELYAGRTGTPYAVTPDPRHFPFLKGTVLYVEDLGGRWAPRGDYGTNIIRDCLIPMIEFGKTYRSN